MNNNFIIIWIICLIIGVAFASSSQKENYYPFYYPWGRGSYRYPYLGYLHPWYYYPWYYTKYFYPATY
jgi:hypothetical protein